MADANDKDKDQKIDTPIPGAGSEDLEGLKKNRDTILAEKKGLQAENAKLLKKIEAAETKTLEEQNKYKELYEKETEKTKALTAKLETNTRMSAFNKAAAVAGMDAEYSEIFFPQAEFDDSGVLQNSEALFAKLKETKPALFSSPQKISTDPAKPTVFKPGEHIYSREEIRNMPPEEYKKNRETIQAQECAGWNYGEK